MNIGIIGCGLIGTKRAQSIINNGDDVSIVCDTDLEKANELGDKIGCISRTYAYELVTRSYLDAVVVSTPNKYLMPIAIDAIKHGKHVLLEKPPGRNLQETVEIEYVARQTKKIVKVGFNHRFHPAIMDAHEICRNGNIGELLYIRSIYGHGGREGYEKEWRMNKEISGGGELLDQGVHIVDLCRWFLGEFQWTWGNLESYCWKKDIEDNAFVTMRTIDDKMVQFHTSWTQWKNQFTFEVFGSLGNVKVEGLGGSYGKESLTVVYKGFTKPPMVETFYYDEDTSWDSEWKNFATAIKTNTRPESDIVDALQTMRVINSIYLSNEVEDRDYLV